MITLEKVQQGWRLTITISDVAAYVEEHTAIDIMASLIGQTLYDKDGTILRHMLPNAYEEACSLLPGKKSYGISLECTWNGHVLTDYKWFESEFYTNRSYTYDEFQQTASPYKMILTDITSYLAKQTINDSHKMVEHLMLFYNTEAGKLLKDRQIGILRRHSTPKQQLLEKYREHIPELEALAFSSAESCLAEEADTTHYGLQSNHYAHASSPIRRYTDLINQRALKIILSLSDANYIVPLAMYDINQRQKAIKQFGRDMDFLDALRKEDKRVSGIILDVIAKNEQTKVKIYIPDWKRTVSAFYKTHSTHTVFSRDETTTIDVSLYKQVELAYVFVMQERNWKKRIHFQILEAD